MFTLLEICVFFSGGVALILEAVYQKYLSTLIGSSTPSATIVLVTYFLGITLGSLLCPKKGGSPRIRLALLELFIALWSVILAIFFYRSYDNLMDALTSWSGNSWTLGLMRWFIAMVWILPPTMAMGAHLPTLECFLETNDLGKSWQLTRLYALNTAGACFFTLITPILFFQNLGLEGTLLLSAGIGFAVAASLFFGLKYFQKNKSSNSNKKNYPISNDNPTDSISSASAPISAKPLSNEINLWSHFSWPIALAFFSGAMVFSLEVIWNHLVASVMGASTYSFSIILGVVLLSLAIASRRIERLPQAGPAEAQSAVSLAFRQLTLALPVTILLWSWSGKLLAVLRQLFNLTSFWSGEFFKICIAFMLIKPVATATGTLFPATFRTLTNGAAPSGREVGFLNVANTLGCVIGALMGNFIFIPTIGSQWTFILLWTICLAAWIVLRWQEKENNQCAVRLKEGFRRVGEPVLGTVIIIIFIILGGWNMDRMLAGYGVYLRGQYYSEAKTLFIREDQDSGFVSVRWQEMDGTPTTTLLQNGKFDANDSVEMLAQIGFGFIPAMFSHAKERALVIGFGSGQTASVIQKLGYKDIDICELSPGHIEAAQKYFNHINNNVLSEKNVHLWLEDGRNFLARSKANYDVVSIEISSIWFAGASNLYSREFYRQIKKHLSHGGILQQWMQLHHLSMIEIATILATVRETFPHVEVWDNMGQAVILASQEPLSFHSERWQEFMVSEKLQAERRLYLEVAGETDDIHFQKRRRFLTTDEIDSVLRETSHVIHTDRNKWLEFHTPLYYLNDDLFEKNIQKLIRFQKNRAD